MPAAPDSNALPHIYLCTDIAGDHLLELEQLFTEAGYTVHVVSLLKTATYRAWSHGTVFQRIWFRLLSKLIGPLLICARSLFWRRKSVIIANTNLLFAPLGLALTAKLRGSKCVYLLYDLYPDAIEVSGGGKRKNSIASLPLRWLTLGSLRCCDATVYLGDFLRAHIQANYTGTRKNAVIDVAAAPDAELWQAGTATHTLPTAQAQAGSAAAGSPTRPLRLRYGGQFGRMHCPLQTATATADAARAFGNRLHIAFFASGAGIAQAGHILESAGITITPPAEEKNWRESLHCYDFALVALSPGGATVCFPSKTYGMIAAGLPLIAICPHWSDLGTLIRENGIGFVVGNSPFDAIIDADGVRRGLSAGAVLDMRSPAYLQDVLALRPQKAISADFSALISHLLESPEEIAKARNRTRILATTACSREAMLHRWQALLASL